MKKNLLILLITGLLCDLTPLRAQTTTTVADGSATNSQIPIYGLYMSSWQHTQIIYPENMLADMVGSSITELSFYTSAPAFNYAWQAPMLVKMGGTDSESFTSANYLTETTETVYSGTLEVATGVMNIVFDTPFVYTGGNLLLEFMTDVKTPNYKGATFKGMSTDSYMSIRGYNSAGLDAITNLTRHSFIPKTTFTYTGGMSCLSPMAATVSDIAEHSAKLNITPREGQNEWEYRLATANEDTTGMPWIVTTDTLNILDNLDDNTPYVVYVRTRCDGETSAFTSAQFRTLCSAINELPVVWGFETDNVEGSASYPLPACWSRKPANSNYPYSYNFNPAHAHTGNYCLCFSSTGTASVCILPGIDTTMLPIQQLQLEFFAKTTASNVNANIEVGVIGDPEDINTFQPVNTFTIQSAAYPAEPYTVLFNEFNGYGSHLAMRMTNASTSIMNICVDDVTLGEIPPCPKVQQLTVNDIGENSISISWSGLNYSYLVRYRAENESIWESVIVSEDSITLMGLDPNTSYVIEVAPDCEEFTDNLFQQITATTLCAAVSIPYFLDFENENMFHCWTVAQPGVIEDFFGDLYFPAIETSPANAYSGSQYMELGAQEGSTAFLVAPKVNQEIETLRLMFYAREPQAYFSANILGTLQVGLMTSPMDTSTFVMLTTIPVSGTTYTLKTVHFDQYSYSGNDYYIAFRYIGAGSDTDNVSGIFLDDLTITVNASCPEPTALNATGITQSSANLSWSGGASNYKVYYRASFEESYTVVAATTTGGTFSLNGLQPATQYYWYVAALCEDGTEAPSMVQQFITSCGIHSYFPYQENFDSYASAMTPNCWDMLPGIVESNYSLPMTLTNGTYSQDAHSAPTALVFGSTTTQSAIAILPQFSEEIRNLRLSFYAKPEGASSGTLKVGYISNPANSSSFVEVFSVATGNLTDYYYHEYLVDFNVTDVPENVRIAFRYDCSNDWLFYIDDIAVNVIPECNAPIQLNASFITGTTANLTWISNAEEVTLYYKPLADDTYASIQVALDSDGVYHLTDLVPSTTYQWYLTIVCEDSTYVSETGSFMTDCAGISSVPQTWTFETGNSGGTESNPLPPCWHRIHTSFPYAYQSTLYNYAHTGQRCLFFNTTSGNLYATIPPINPEELSLDTLQLKFFARVYSSSLPYDLEVGVMDDPMDATTFVSLDTFHITSGLYDDVAYRVKFTNYTGEGHYIAFRCLQASSANVYIDDVTLQTKPECEPVDDLVASDLTTTSATLTWTEEDDVNSFTVEYKMSSSTTWLTQTVSVPMITLSGLMPATTYNVRVKPDCSQSVEFVNITFKTPCETITDFPYNESFEGGDFGCWTPFASGTGNSWQNHQYNSIFQNPQDGDLYVYYHSSSLISYSNGLLVSPALDLSNMYVPAVSFFYDAIGDSYGVDSIAIMFRTSATDTWHFLKGYGGHSSLEVTWNNDTVNLIMPSSTYQIAFFGMSHAGGGIFLDNITVLEHATAQDSIQEPTVTTYPATAITQTGATLNGAITDPGNQPVTAQGFEWKAVSDIDYQTVLTTGDIFSHELTGLTDGTTYTYRAFATTANTTTRGADMTFSTLIDHIEEHLTSSIALYPNPANEYVDVRVDGNINIRDVEVYDVYGKIVAVVKTVCTPYSQRIDISTLSSGTYFVRVTTDAGTGTKMLVKSN